MADEWISTGEAAERLGISRASVRRRVDEGLIKSRWTQPGGRGWRQVLLSSVEEYRASLAADHLDGGADA